MKETKKNEKNQNCVQEIVNDLSKEKKNGIPMFHAIHVVQMPMEMKEKVHKKGISFLRGL